jgi:hypothetical protein
VAMRFNPPPGWPPPPEGFTPDPGWQPDPSWPPAPPGWQLWVPDELGSDASSVLTPGSVGYPRGPALADYGQQSAWDLPAPPPSGTNGMAIAAFVLGLVGFVWICAILGIVFGIIALNRTRRTFERGRRLAIAGIVLGSVWLAVLVGLIVFLVVFVGGGGSNGSSSAPPASASIGASSQTVDPFTLNTGDCFDNPTPTLGQVQRVTSVVQTPCTQPHNAQIFATFNVQGSLLSYPGDAKMRSLAESGCNARIAASLDRAKITNSMTIRFLFPLEGSWLGGQRTISCIIYNPTPTLTSSLLKS